MIDYEKRKKAILESIELSELHDDQKPPIPKLQDGDNYVFISYSHKDYKAVYCDLLDFHRAGVRYWYDCGLPAGKEWDLVVEQQIKGPGCAGVIFYLSDNLFLSRSVNKEVAYTLGTSQEGSSDKNYFCINLRGVPPTKILKQIIRTYDDDELEKFGIDDRMSSLLQAFSDKATYITKKGNSDDSHIPDTVRQIAAQFNVVAAESRSDDNDAVSLLKEQLEFAKTFVISDGVLVKYLGTDAVVTIPNNVHTIGEQAFRSCTSLEAVHFPDGLTCIEKQAFLDCKNLSGLSLPDNLQEIGEDAFSGCVNAVELEDNTVYLGNWLLLSPPSILLYTQKIKQLTVRQGTIGLANMALRYSSLIDILLPDSLRRIGERSLWQYGKESIVIPGSVEYIGKFALAESYQLKTVFLPASVRIIDSGAFYWCNKLTDIHYAGTMAQWKQIYKGEQWDGLTLSYVIHCSDVLLQKEIRVSIDPSL